jgi:hypothetical protein
MRAAMNAVVTPPQQPPIAQIADRLVHRFRERYRPEEHASYAEGQESRFNAACALLARVAEAANLKPGPWLDEEIEIAECLSIALLELIEAADATYGRHLRRRHGNLWPKEDCSRLIRLASKLHDRRVSCSDVVWLNGLMHQAAKSGVATTGDPSFLWRGRGRPQ